LHVTQKSFHNIKDNQFVTLNILYFYKSFASYTMKKFRKILFFILCISLIIIAIGFLLPAKVHVERSLVIDALPEDIFEQVNTLKNWEKWSPWIQSDSIIQIEYSGPESGVGSGLTWKGTDSYIDNASIAIIYSVPYDSLLFVLEFGKNGISVLKIFIIEDGNINSFTEKF